ncbi:MAG TPA: sigma-70 family RNA polymerase sigma factor [Gemmatimonadaceae bacterium]
MSSSNPDPSSDAGVDALLEARFDGMVRREYARLAELACMLLGNRADAEEVVQDVLLGVWRQRARFDFDRAVPYLVRAVRNRAHSRRRLRWHRVTRLLGPSDDWAGDTGDEWVERDELLRALDAAVASLPSRSREVFVLHRVNGLSYADIASSLGISRKTVENLMGRTLQRLRRALRGHLGLPFLVALAARCLVR